MCGKLDECSRDRGVNIRLSLRAKTKEKNWVNSVKLTAQNTLGNQDNLNYLDAQNLLSTQTRVARVNSLLRQLG